MEFGTEKGQISGCLVTQLVTGRLSWWSEKYFSGVFSLGFDATTWNSKKQDKVALSSSEAEYVASIVAVCQAIWLRRLLSDFQ